MKKHKLYVLCILVCTAVIANQALGQIPKIGTILDLKGTVMLLKSGSTKWQPLPKKGSVELDSSIRTGDQSQAKIKLPDGSIIQVAEKTEIKLTKAMEGEPGSRQSDLSLEDIMNLKTVVEVSEGRTSIKVEKKPASENAVAEANTQADLSLEDIMSLKLLVKTKNSVIGVHGTEFTVIANPSKALVVCQQGQGRDLIVANGSPASTDLKSFTNQFMTSQHSFVTQGNLSVSDSKTMINAVAAPVLMAKLEGMKVESQAPQSVIPPGLPPDSTAPGSQAKPKIALNLTNLNNLDSLQVPGPGAIYDATIGAFVPAQTATSTSTAPLSLSQIAAVQISVESGLLTALTSYTSSTSKLSGSKYLPSTEMTSEELASAITALTAAIATADDSEKEMLAEALSYINAALSKSSVSVQSILLNLPRLNSAVGTGLIIGVTTQ